jgi:hypothetical protein
MMHGLTVEEEAREVDSAVCKLDPKDTMFIHGIKICFRINSKCFLKPWGP